jgi:hypothetical protein
MFVYAMFVFLIVLQIALFQTRWGLRVRSVGEHPKAADTLGIDVIKTRYMSVLLGGMMAGFAGAYFTLGSAGPLRRSDDRRARVYRPGSHDFWQLDSGWRIWSRVVIRFCRFVGLGWPFCAFRFLPNSC